MGAQAAPLKGVAVVSHHKNMTYLWAWLGVREVGTLEPKPGIEPSAGHLSALSAQLVRQPAKMVVRSAYQDGRASQWLCRSRAGPAVALPFTVGGNDKATDLFGLFDSTVALLLAVRASDLRRDRPRHLAPAFLAGLLVLSTHVPLGAQVLRKGIVFIDLAIAQIAALGVIVAGAVRGRSRRLAGAARRRRAALPAPCCSTGPSASGRRCRRRRSGSCSCSRRPPASCCWRRTRMAASTCATCWPGRSSGSATPQLGRAGGRDGR